MNVSSTEIKTSRKNRQNYNLFLPALTYATKTLNFDLIKPKSISSKINKESFSFKFVNVLFADFNSFYIKSQKLRAATNKYALKIKTNFDFKVF